MPMIAPHLFARFQNTPSTSAGKNAEAASENAAPTRNRMSPGLSDVTYAAMMRDDHQQHLRDRHAASWSMRVGSIIL